MSKDDPRKAETIEDAARNPDGTYNALKALSWLSEAIRPGKGLPLSEVKQIAEEVKQRKAADAMLAARQKGTPDE